MSVVYWFQSPDKNSWDVQVSEYGLSWSTSRLDIKGNPVQLSLELNRGPG